MIYKIIRGTLCMMSNFRGKGALLRCVGICAILFAGVLMKSDEIFKSPLHILSSAWYNNHSQRDRDHAVHCTANPQGVPAPWGFFVLTVLFRAHQATCKYSSQLYLLRWTQRDRENRPLNFTSFPLLGRRGQLCDYISSRHSPQDQKAKSAPISVLRPGWGRLL